MTTIAQPWTDPRTAHLPIQFASDAAQGTFNATLAQLGSNLLRDYDSPPAKDRKNSPPIWISTIGRDGFWPITTVRLDAKNPQCADPSQDNIPKLFPSDEIGPILATRIHTQSALPESTDITRPIWPLQPPQEIWTLAIISVLLLAIAIGVTCFGRGNLSKLIKDTEHPCFHDGGKSGDASFSPIKNSFSSRSVVPKLSALVSLVETEQGFRHQRHLVLAALIFMFFIAYHFIPFITVCTGNNTAGEFSTRIIGAFLVLLLGNAFLFWFASYLFAFCSTLMIIQPLSLLALCAGFIAACFAMLGPTTSAQDPWVLFVQRDVALLNGVSLLMPVLLLLLLVGIRSFTAICIEADSPPRGMQAKSKLGFVGQMKRDLQKPGAAPLIGAVLLTTVLVARIASFWVYPSNSILTFSFFILFVFVIHHALLMTWRTVHRWKMAQKLVRHVGMQPCLTAFDRLPQQVSARLGLYLSSSRPRSWFTDLRMERARKSGLLLVGINPNSKSVPEGEEPPLHESNLLTPEPDDRLKTHWAFRDSFGELRIKRDNTNDPSKEARKEDSKELRIADDVYALDVVDRLNWLARRLKFALVELLYSLVGLLLVVCSFPIPGQPYWVALFVVWLTGLAMGAIWIVFCCERDEVLSRIANTQPHRLSWSSEMIKSLAAFLIPVGLAVTTVFPEVYESLVIIFHPLWTMFVRN
jgi:hypothetical protein